MHELHSLKPAHGSTTRTKRIGRGHGSGRGTTAGKGTKGQRARAGGRRGIIRRSMKSYLLRIPKVRGFRSRFDIPAEVTLMQLQKYFADGARVTLKTLSAKKLIPGGMHKVKILGGGTLSKKLTVIAHAYTASAKAAIEAAGGSALFLGSSKEKNKTTH